MFRTASILTNGSQRKFFNWSFHWKCKVFHRDLAESSVTVKYAFENRDETKVVSPFALFRLSRLWCRELNGKTCIQVVFYSCRVSHWNAGIQTCSYAVSYSFNIEIYHDLRQYMDFSDCGDFVAVIKAKDPLVALSFTRELFSIEMFMDDFEPKRTEKKWLFFFERNQK